MSKLKRIFQMRRAKFVNDKTPLHSSKGRPKKTTPSLADPRVQNHDNSSSGKIRFNFLIFVSHLPLLCNLLFILHVDSDKFDEVSYVEFEKS